MLTGLPTILTDRLALLPEPRSVDLWTFTSKSGTTYRWCDGEVNRTWGGNTWLAHQAAIVRGDCDSAAGDQASLEIDSLDVTITAADDAQTVAGKTFDAAVLAGQLDGSVMRYHRLFLADDGSQLGAIEVFGGLVQQIEPNANEVKLVIKSYLALGGGDNLAMGSSTSSDWMLSVSCPFAFGDVNCGFSASDVGGTVAGVVLNAFGYVTAITFPTASAWTVACVPGAVISFTTGPAAGKIVTVRKVTSNGGTTSVGINPTVEPPLPGAGDTFSVTPFCAKTYSACDAFGNRRRFGGFPWIPVNATDLIEG